MADLFDTIELNEKTPARDIFDQLQPEPAAKRDIFDAVAEPPTLRWEMPKSLVGIPGGEVPIRLAPDMESVVTRPNVEEQVKAQTWATLTPGEKLSLDLARGGRAVIEGGGLAAQGAGVASTVLPPVPMDMGGPYNPADADLLSRWQARRAGQTPADVRKEIEANPAYQAGTDLRATAEKTFPSVQPESVKRPLGALAEGVGSTVSFLPAGMAGPLGVAYMGALQNGAAAYDEALKRGADDEQAQSVFWWNAAGGTSEALPISRIFQRINKASGGTVGKALREMLVSGLEEGTQETFQQTLQNATAKHIYDEERQYLEGVAQGGGVGFGTGFLLAALGMGTRGAAARLNRPVAERRAERMAEEDRAQRMDAALEQSANRQALESSVPLATGGRVVQVVGTDPRNIEIDDPRRLTVLPKRRSLRKAKQRLDIFDAVQPTEGGQYVTPERESGSIPIQSGRVDEVRQTVQTPSPGDSAAGTAGQPPIAIPAQAQAEWLINITPPSATAKGKPLPGVVQVDMMAGEVNTGSTNPEELRARGVDIPTKEDFYRLPKGRYTLSQALEMLAALPEVSAQPEPQSKGGVIPSAKEKSEGSEGEKGLQITPATGAASPPSSLLPAKQRNPLEAQRDQIRRILGEIDRRREADDGPLPSRAAEDALKARLKVIEEELYVRAKRSNLAVGPVRSKGIPKPVELTEDDKLDPRMDEPGVTRPSARPGAITIQLRDLSSIPIREVYIDPTGDDLTDAKNVVKRIRQEAADDNRVSLRESAGTLTDERGMGITHYSDSPNGPAWTSVANLIEARKQTTSYPRPSSKGWKDIEEGPFKTKEEAQEFADAEVGVEFRIVRLKNRMWIIETRVEQEVDVETVTEPKALPPAKKPSVRKGKKPETPPAKSWKSIGKNAAGNEVFEDDNGVRSYVENGIRVTQPVRMIPTREGIQTQTGEPGPEFTPVDQAESKTEKTAIIIARDRVLATQAVQNALANSTETNAKAEIAVQLKKVLGEMATEMVNKTGVDSVGRTWAESYDAAADPKDRESFVNSFYRYALRNPAKRPESDPEFEGVPAPESVTSRKSTAKEMAAGKLAYMAFATGNTGGWLAVEGSGSTEVNARADALSEWARKWNERIASKKPVSETTEAKTETKEPSSETKLPEKWTPADVDYFTKQVEDGSMVFWAGNDMRDRGLPIFQDIPNLEHLGYGTFRGKGDGYEIVVDGGGAMSRTDSGVSYTIAQVKGEYPYDRDAVLKVLRGMSPDKPATKDVAATDVKNLSEAELDAMLDDVFEPKPKKKAEPKAPAAPRKPSSSIRKPKEEPRGAQAIRDEIKKLKQGLPVAEDMAMNDKGASLDRLQKKIAEAQARLDALLRPPEAAPQPTEKTAAQIAAEAAKHGVKGVDEAVKGLHKLFGGGKNLGSDGVSFDEKTYAEAKPHFLEAYRQFVAAGKSLKEFMQYVFDNFGAASRQYLKRFVQDVQAGNIESEATDESNERPMGPKPGDLDEGSTAGSSQKPGAETGGAPGESGSGGTGGAAGASSGGKGGRRGGRTGAGGTVPGGTGDGESTADQRPGVGEDAGNAEVRRGRDVEPTDNLRIQPEDKLAPENRAARIKANLKAWQLSKKIATAKRNATPEEKRILMQFSGWGDTFQVFGLTKIGEHREAADVYEQVKEGRQLYNILWNEKEREQFERWRKQYAEAYDELKASLTDAEWKSASESSLNAHFTSRVGIEALWQIVKRSGWTGGTAIETSAGIGNIIGLTPDDFAGKVHWLGIELDKMTGQMLSQLYPASDIQNSPFERSLRTENNNADLVISNFPFGDYPIADIGHPDYDGWSVHNYFLARSIDALKPGAIAVAITSRYTMDGAKGVKMRQWLAKRADLIGAIRLPDTAFKASAGTEVVTDILVFQKKTGIGGMLGQRFASLSPVDIPAALRSKQKESETDEEYQARLAKVLYVNEYFAEHPEMVLGSHTLQGTMYGGDGYTVKALEGELADQLAAAIARLPANFVTADQTSIEDQDKGEDLGFVSGQKADSYIVQDGDIYQVDDQGRLSRPEHIKSAAAKATARKLIELRNATLAQIELELNPDSEDAAIEQARKKLNELYDAFRKSRGALNLRANNLIDDDPEWPLVASLEEEITKAVEVVVKDRKVTRFEPSYVKGLMLTRRVNFPRTEPAKADSLTDAVSISINYRGGISPEYIASLTGMTADEVREKIITEQLAFENPDNGLLETPDLYLSGFVKKKLDAARRAAETNPKYSRNVEALQKVQPRDLPAEQIHFRLGSNWIDPKMVERFMRAVLEIDVTVSFIRAGDETRWIVSAPARDSVANSETFAAGGNDNLAATPAHLMIEDALNLKLTEVSLQVEDEHGNKKTIKLPEETAAARDMQDRIQDEFRKWVKTTPAEATELETIYNRLFNGMVRREYPVPNFDRFPGASDAVKLRDWQKRAAVRSVQEGTMLAHTVGTGKTYTLITAAMEMRRLRTARKPMVVVQNSTLTQFANSFRKLYPTARLLIGNAKQTEGKKRKAFMARLTTGDWDAVVIPASFFERIPNDPEREQAYVQEQLDNIDALIDDAEGPNFDGKRAKTPLGKQLLRVRRRFEARMQRILDRLANKADDLIDFEKMGVDALLVDEAHNFKRGDFQTKMDRIKGLDTNGSDKSMDFLLKTRFIHDHSPDRNVILATGTPISNTLAELWTMLRYARPGLLKEFGVETFDDFVSTFAKSQATLEETPTGGFAQVLRLARYVNGPEIGNLWRAGADVYVLNREDFQKMGMNVPEIEGGIPTEIVLDRSEPVSQFVNFLRDWRNWWEDQEGKVRALSTWVPIVQYGLARKAAIDLRLINPNWLDDPDSKVNRVVKDVFQIWQDTKADRGTQLIFTNLFRSHDPDKRWLNEDLHLPNPLYGVPVFNVFDDMRRKLIALGVPETEIADFSGLKEAAKAATAEQLKAGNVRIAFGTTESLGTGLNVQDRIAAIHHVDPQFRPMDFEQRNGRGLRQGNANKTVKINVYGVKNTMDSTLYQLMLIKQKFIAQMMTADNLSREFEDPSDDSVMSFQAMSAAFSGNPLFARRFALENEVRKLRILEEDHDRRKSSIRNSLRQAQEGGRSFEDAVEVLLRSRDALAKAFEGDTFDVVFKDQRASGEDGKKLLASIYDEAFEQMRTNFKEEFASGDLHKANAKEIKEKLKWRGEDGKLELDARKRTRRVSINGVQFELDIWQRAEIPLVKEKGDIKLTDENNRAWFSGGRWKVLGQNSVSWSDDSPWYNSINEIRGNAETADGLETSFRHSLRSMGEQLAKVQAGRERIAKTVSDLKKQVDVPFESANRLVQQEENLAEVLRELEASGASLAAAQPPSMDDIVQRFPQFAYLTREVAAENSADVMAQITQAENDEAKKSFYVRTADGYQRVKGAKVVELPGWKWAEFFQKKGDKEGVDISESSTGMRVGHGKTLEAAKANALEKLAATGEDKFRTLIRDAIVKHGRSPRAKAQDANPSNYTRLQEGGVVAVQHGEDRLVGTVRQLLLDSGEVGIDIGGALQVWPVRLVEPGTAEDAKRLAESQVAPDPTVLDKAIETIEQAQARLRQGPQSGQTLMGVPQAILDTALEMARLALKGASSVQQALEVALSYIRGAVAQFDEAAVRAHLQSKLAEPATPPGDETQIQGRSLGIAGKPLAPDIPSQITHAQNILSQFGLPVTMVQRPDSRMPGSPTKTQWRLAPDGQNHDAAGMALADYLEQRLSVGDPAEQLLLSNLTTSIAGSIADGEASVAGADGRPMLSEAVRDRLLNLTQAPASHAGQLLALRGQHSFDPEGVLEYARDVGVHLRQVWRENILGGDATGGPQLVNLLERLLTAFREYFSDSEVTAALKPLNLEATIDRLIQLNERDAGGRVYRAVQARLKAKRPKSEAMKERQAKEEEAVEAMILRAAELGKVEPPKLLNQKLTADEQLALLTQPEVAAQIQAAMEQAIADAERAAGIRATVNAAEKEDRPDIIASFQERDEDGNWVNYPEPDMIEEGLDLPEFEHWRLLRDNLLQYSPTTVKAVEAVITGRFRGTRFKPAEVKPPDLRIDLKALAVAPDDEVQRVFGQQLAEIQALMADADIATVGRVSQMVEEKLAQQLAMARRREVDRLFAEQATGRETPEAIELLKRKINAGLLRDQRLTDAELAQRVASRAILRNNLPTVGALVKRILEAPRYKLADIRQDLAAALVKELGLTGAQAAELSKLVYSSLEGTEEKPGPLRRARVQALDKVKAELSPAERKIEFGKGRTMWQRLERAVRAGLFDPGSVLEDLAREKGYTIPTEEQKAKMRELAEEEMRLRTPTQAEIDKHGLELATRYAEKGTESYRVKLIKQMQANWSRWAHPIKLWSLDATLAQNRAKAVDEFVASNLLLTTGFLVRQGIDVGLVSMPLNAINRSLAHLMERGGNPAELGAVLKEMMTARIATLKQTVNSAAYTAMGSSNRKVLDRAAHSLAIFDRAHAKAAELEAAGNQAGATALRLATILRAGYRIAETWDVVQSVGTEWQEMRQQLSTDLKLAGKSRGEVNTILDDLFGGIKLDMAEGVRMAEALAAERGVTPTALELQENAWNLVKARAYDRMRQLSGNGTNYEAENDQLKELRAWNLPETGGVGGVLAETIKGVRARTQQAGVPTGGLFSFGNAIGTATNRMLTFMGGGLFNGWGFGNSPWYQGERNKRERRLEAMEGLAVIALVAALAAAGVILVQVKYPDDKDEKERFIAEGHKINTVRFNNPDGRWFEAPIQMSPFSFIAPALYMIGGIQRIAADRERAQKKLDTDAARLGLPAEQLPGMGAGEVMSVLAQGAYGMLTGGRTAFGAIQSFSDYGNFNLNRAASSLARPYIPGLPAWGEAARAMGAAMDTRTASFLQLLVPTPWSGNQKVNALGDPLRNQDDVVRVLQTLSGGFGFGKPTQDQHAYRQLFAAGYSPQEVSRTRGYNFGGVFRPMTTSELERYSVARGEVFKEELQGVEVEGLPEAEALKQVRAAYARANSRALAAVGVTATKSATTSPTMAQTRLPEASVTAVSFPTVPRIARTTRGPSIRRPRRARTGRTRARVKGPTLRIGRGLRTPRGLRVRRPSLRKLTVKR